MNSFKVKYLITFSLITSFVFFGSERLFAQLQATYLFTEITSNYTQINGTLISSTSDDDQIFIGNGGGAFTQTGAGYPIGFTFKYNNINYTRFGVSTNGYIKLGNTPSFSMNCSGYYENMEATGDNTLIGGMVNDIQAQNGSSLQYLTTGNSPNRKLIVQWKEYRLYGASEDSINFQIILYETINEIELSYGTFIYGKNHPNHGSTSMAGLYGESNFDYFLRSSNWKSSNQGNSKSSNIPFNKNSLPNKNTRFKFQPIQSSLPIELINWTANCDLNKVVFSWATMSEKNNDYFTIEKSQNEMGWDEVKSIKGAGNSNIPLFYSSSFVNNTSEITYYRLKQTDFDGKYSYADIISTTCDNKVENNKVSFYPNPTTGNIIISSIDDNTTLNLVNSKGQSVLQTNLVSNKTYLNISNQINGVYFVIITSKNNTFKEKLIINK